ncbi:hypothetical protein L226DRAFT_275873 [Lentinus tigrinus ALCF2SS1-7]|uniref:uncharacterized protein n=1 Tax=Lentinus tigrinus ALCF2SS1-7 TaxID=1328758 RepID=UPI001165E347|nr:hypothetical protein L226DRAFT_275873 [Lentinus tigrinus ALCF2SS1-7]
MKGWPSLQPRYAHRQFISSTLDDQPHHERGRLADRRPLDSITANRWLHLRLSTLCCNRTTQKPFHRISMSEFHTWPVWTLCYLRRTHDAHLIRTGGGFLSRRPRHPHGTQDDAAALSQSASYTSWSRTCVLFARQASFGHSSLRDASSRRPVLVLYAPLPFSLDVGTTRTLRGSRARELRQISACSESSVNMAGLDVGVRVLCAGLVSVSSDMPRVDLACLLCECMRDQVSIRDSRQEPGRIREA